MINTFQMSRQKLNRKFNQQLELFPLFFVVIGYVYSAFYQLNKGTKKDEYFVIDNSDYKFEIKLKLK
jgi:hypothetical protein